MKNKKGIAETTVLILAAAAIITIHHTQYKTGKWGKNGTDNLKARQDKIIANGGHINTAPNSQRKTFDYYAQP